MDGITNENMSKLLNSFDSRSYISVVVEQYRKNRTVGKDPQNLKAAKV